MSVKIWTRFWKKLPLFPSQSSLRDTFSYHQSESEYAYARLEDQNQDDHDDDNDDDDMAGPADDIVVNESSRNGFDATMAKRVLRKIDMMLIPLLFITYALNFMDKTILSSASVFGLRDDTVRRTFFPTPC